MTQTSAGAPADQPLESFWAVVPAGGAGTRLWPLSRQGAPKFLLDLTGAGRTLLQATLDRLDPLTGGRALVVTGAAHRDAVVAQLPALGAEDVVAEPSARDSMAAIGLAAALLERRDPEAVMGSFAADHVITDQEAFRAAVSAAHAAAREGWLVTIGIEPTGPATGFGYVRPGEPLPGLEARQVAEFVEKPSAEVATAYVEAGYRWNAGMFVVRPSVLLDLLADSDPEFAAALRGIAADPTTLEDVWGTLPKIAIDHAVAEPAAARGKVAVVPGGFGWDDVGDFASLGELLGAGRAGGGAGGAGGPVVLGDRALVRSVDSTGLVVPAGGRTVAVVGLDDVVVVDTGDALLVTTRARAQEVKSIVAALKEDGHDELV
ncbi:mannose-1-phosphate guanylyltransferase [Nocardioides campestrisoli]|uniref:mannose-1-phosphate guanylyltransferase n=1 Tax=Nocardioides campestrisoli TaxID=2736757 RepID=UPI00163D7F4A|nr:mannose-1-phosphate guanylyltransferase [Nocardioides campestrisoli]